MAKDNLLKNKSFDFAVRIVRVYQYLVENKEFVISKQLLRSGTSIGANVWESQRAQSTSDFAAKLYVSLKEANETEYWLMLLEKTNYLTEKQSCSLLDDCRELIKLLVSITKKVSPQNKCILSNP